jgi:NADP-dependent 3-hydroxy acid dehydrogenase YdfG
LHEFLTIAWENSAHHRCIIWDWTSLRNRQVEAPFISNFIFGSEYAKHGSHLILAARRTDRLNDLKARLESEFPKSRVIALTMDVRDKSTVDSAIESLPAEFKNIDILLNNAGLVLGLDPLEMVNSEELNIMLDTNVKGLIYVTQAVLPLMKKRPWGAIVNLNSIAGTEAYPNGSI